MSKIVLFMLILSSVAINSFSQSYEINSALDFYRSHKMSTGEYNQGITEDNIQGSPYLSNDFVEGTLFTTSKQQYNDVLLRFNIYTDNLEYKNNEDQIMAMASPEIIERAKFGDTEMVYIPYSSAKKIRRGFFKVVVEGEISLYVRPQVIYKQPEEPKAYAEAAPARFVQRPDLYYLRNGKNEAIRVDKKKELIEFFPAHNDEIAAFIKKNKIKLKLEGLIEVVKYYNSNF